MISRCAVVVLLALGVTGCGSSPVPLSFPGARAALTVDGQAVVLLESPRRSSRVVVYMHGAGETAMSIETDPLKAPVVRALLRDGCW